MLHYRNTGEFGRNLVANATTAQQRAYAYGYLSHIATDSVGHAYVNQIVGGPYRMHIQRHVTVENFMDSLQFSNKYNKESINKLLLDKLSLLETTLSTDIIDLIDKSFHDTYSRVKHPCRVNDGFLSKEQIEETYEIFSLIF